MCCAKSLQLCLTLCDPMDCSLPSSSVHWILQARILEGVAIPFSGIIISAPLVVFSRLNESLCKECSTKPNASAH